MIKIGRRGSLNATLEIYGKQGHVAYPEYARNPITDLAKVFSVLLEQPLDTGNKYFQPSNLEFTSIDVGNATCNIIPNKLEAKFVSAQIAVEGIMTKLFAVLGKIRQCVIDLADQQILAIVQTAYCLCSWSHTLKLICFFPVRQSLCYA